MANRATDLILTASAPAIWGTTYYVTSEMLPQGYPATMAMLRALPAGLLLLAITRRLPPAGWIGRIMLLSALNFTIFWYALFVAAYRLPGGLAATLGATTPLMVLVLARIILGIRIPLLAVVAAVAGLSGVALLVISPHAGFDVVGALAAGISAASFAFGTVLTRKWQPPVPPLIFTAWQLTAGGLQLLVLCLLVEPAIPAFSAKNVAGLVWLGLIGSALTYFLWFRGIARLGPTVVTGLGFLSPVTAVAVGFVLLDQRLFATDLLGIVIVLGSVALGQAAARRVRPVADSVPEIVS